MNIGEKGIALIKEFEGCRLAAYLDSVGVPTIGYGHTFGVKMGDVCTQDESDQFLLDDLRDAEKCVNGAVTVPLTEYFLGSGLPLWHAASDRQISGRTAHRSDRSIQASQETTNE